MSRISCVRSITRRFTILSILRCCDGLRSWSKRSTSASTEAAAPAISSSLPAPTSVAGSGRSRRCRISPTTLAPALSASARSSASDSSASNSGMLGLALDLAAVPAFEGCIAAASREADAWAVTVPFAPLRPRVRTSTPTRKARSCCDSLRSSSRPASEARGTRPPARDVSRDFLD